MSAEVEQAQRRVIRLAEVLVELDASLASALAGAADKVAPAAARARVKAAAPRRGRPRAAAAGQPVQPPA
jgi:hypothetical protein